LSGIVPAAGHRERKLLMAIRLFMICSLLLLSACAAHRATSEAPEGQRLKGTQKPYTVNGERYAPLASHEGFVQEGKASWYGKDFHGKLTSNGERYDMYAMTAAHKTLPLGVYVRVYNKSNGNEAIVRVNDRGPFVKGRIIDLSFTAAKKLGIVDSGTAPVRIEALGYGADSLSGKAAYRTPVSYDAGSYTVQVGAFTVQANAQRLAKDMKERSGVAEIKKATVNGEQFYRVCAGRYQSLKAAEAARESFEHKGFAGSFVLAED